MKEQYTLWQWVDMMDMNYLKEQIECHVAQFVDGDSEGQYRDALVRCIFISIRQRLENKVLISGIRNRKIKTSKR